MSFPLWHSQVIKKIQPISEWRLIFNTSVFGALIMAAMYAYIVWLKIPNPLNKSVADTAIILMGLSMLLSSVCYFWNFADTKIIYRKHLGLVGLAFMIWHIVLSPTALQRLLSASEWAKAVPWAPLTGAIATVIFVVMGVISNQHAALALGGKIWRGILRTGYWAVAAVWLHVYFLKINYIVKWYSEGMKTPPSSSLLVLVFMTVVMLARLALSISLAKKAASPVVAKTNTQSKTVRSRTTIKSPKRMKAKKKK